MQKGHLIILQYFTVLIHTLVQSFPQEPIVSPCHCPLNLLKGEIQTERIRSPVLNGHGILLVGKGQEDLWKLP